MGFRKSPNGALRRRRIEVRLLIPALLLVTSCDYPHWRFDDFELQARFEADGTCSFSVDGNSLSNPSYSQEVANWRDDCAGCASDAVDAYRLVCRADLTDEGAMSLPVLYVTVSVPRDSQPHAKSFDISDDASAYREPGGEVSVLQVPGIRSAGFRTGLTGAHLTGRAGSVEVRTLQRGEVHRRNGFSGRAEATVTASLRRKASGL